MITVGGIECLVCTVFGVLVFAEEDFEYVGARDAPLCLDLRMQLPVFAYVVDEACIFGRLRLVVRDQRIHQAELGQLREDVVDGVIHRIERVDERRVPVEQHDTWRNQRPRCFVEFPQHFSLDLVRFPDRT